MDRYASVFCNYDLEPFIALSEQQVQKELYALTPDPVNAQPLENAELFAFRFKEYHGKNTTEVPSFYIPHRKYIDEQGAECVFPDIREVTVEMVAYWVQRAEESKHPVIRARYAGLVHEFSSIVTGQRAHYLVSRTFAKSLLDSAALINVFLYRAGKLKKALSVALELNDKQLAEEIKDAILMQEKSVPLNETRSFWNIGFDILVVNRNTLLKEDEEAELISRLHNRYGTLLPLDNEAAWQAVQRLCTYYHAKKQTDRLVELLSEFRRQIACISENQYLFHKINWLDRLRVLYEKMGLKERANEMLIEIRELSRNTGSLLKSVIGQSSIPQSELDRMIDEILESGGDELFARIVAEFSIREDDIKGQIEEAVRIHPLNFIISKDLLDKKGRKVGVIMPFDESPEQHFVLYSTNHILLFSIFFRLVVDEGESRGLINAGEIMNFVRLSRIFEKPNLSIVARSMDYYFAMDYLAFIHVIIPQIEEAIRNLIEYSGGNVLVPARDGTYMLKTLDHLLSDQIAIDRLGASACLQLKALLTAKTGINLRNEVAHGMFDPDKFNMQHADALLLTFLTLVFQSVMGETGGSVEP